MIRFENYATSKIWCYWLVNDQMNWLERVIVNDEAMSLIEDSNSGSSDGPALPIAATT